MQTPTIHRIAQLNSSRSPRGADEPIAKPERCSWKRGAPPSRSLCSASRRTVGAVDPIHYFGALGRVLPARRRDAERSSRDDCAPHQSTASVVHHLTFLRQPSSATAPGVAALAGPGG